YRDRGAWDALLGLLARTTLRYLTLQITAGAEAVQLFDSWVGTLAPDDYRTFVLPHTRTVIRALPPEIPVIHFGTGTPGLLEAMREAGGDVIGLDWRVDLGQAWARLGPGVAVQGNLDPAALLAPPAEIRRRVERILARAAGRPGHGLNPGHVGMRSWHPYLHETLAGMAGDGVRHALGVILSAQQTEASWSRYQATVDEARARVGPEAPAIGYAPAWFDRPGFIQAIVDRVRQALAGIAPAVRGHTRLVFTAHSVPVAMAAASPYVAQLRTSCRLVAEGLGHPSWAVAYQSRSGRPEEPWLEPDVGDVIRGLAAEGAAAVVVVPIGFVC